MNVRLVQALVDFSGQDEVSSWDADRNTEAIIAMLPFYRAYGVNAIGVNVQGGNFASASPAPALWGEDYDCGLFNPSGSLRSAHSDRLIAFVDACIATGLTPIVGLFYQRQDQVLTDTTAVETAMTNIMTLLDSYKTQILIEVANEIENGSYDHALFTAANITPYVDDFVAAGFFASVSHNGGVIPTSGQQGDGQFLLLHANGLTEAELETMVADAIADFPNTPIIINEDGDASRTTTELQDRCAAAVAAGSGWGYHEPTGKQYYDLTPMVTMNWGVDLATELAAFGAIELATDADGPNETGVAPDADIAATGWDTNPTGSQPLYQQLDETTPSDTDFIDAVAT